MGGAKGSRFQELRQRQEEGRLSEAEQAQLALLMQELEAAEAAYLSPATERIRQDRETLEDQNRSLEALVRHKETLNESDNRPGCCGMDAALEQELLSLIREGERPLKIIKRLHEATGVSIQHCIRWVAEHQPNTIMPCPYCQAPLATTGAKQCFECGYDWHDPNHVIRHGDPN